MAVTVKSVDGQISVTVDGGSVVRGLQVGGKTYDVEDGELKVRMRTASQNLVLSLVSALIGTTAGFGLVYLLTHC